MNLRKFVSRLLTSLLGASIVHAGILIYRTDKGLEFTDATAITVAGKDKVLAIGPQPAPNVPIAKLPSVKLGGTLLRDPDTGLIVLRENGQVTYIVPQGAAKTITEPLAIWKASKISYKKSPSDKTSSDVSPASFVAYLPEGLEELVALASEESALRLMGGKAGVFPTQLELMAAVVKTYQSNPAVAPMERFVAQSMRQRYDLFESGAAGVESLEQGLQFAELSQAVYPNSAEQDQLRKALRDRKAWLDRKKAVLNAFNSAQEWDALLLADRDFERYQQAFPDLMAKHAAALAQSLETHRQAGEQYLKAEEYGPAWRELRLASSRKPSDKILLDRVSNAWTEYSSQLARDSQGSRKQLHAGDTDQIQTKLRQASLARDDKKLDRALELVTDAEKIDAKSLEAQLKKAEILGEMREFNRALEALDQYDLVAVDAERKKSTGLRGDLLYKRESALETVNVELEKAWAASSFHRALDLALEGLRARNDDAGLLYRAGIASLVLRDPKQARSYFARYLEISNTLDANADSRAQVRRLMAAPSSAAKAEDGVPNWLSGKKLASGTFYCPITLAFQPRIDHIEANNKLKVNFVWDTDRLRSIVPAFDKNERVTPEKTIQFAYDETYPQVSWAGYEGQLHPQFPSDPDERFRNSMLVASNNPYADPVQIQKLTGKNVTVALAGNAFFNPFVWEKLHYFRLTYDDAGRVIQARELSDAKGAPTDASLDFKWEGDQLMEIRGFRGAEEKSRTPYYSRTMKYQNGRLMGEEINGSGKSSKITYNYNGNRLVSAHCETDTTVDNRSRTVTFLGNSPSVQVR